MPGDPADRQDPIEHCRQVLRAAGVRVTHQRLEVFREVLGSRSHPDAESVFRGVRDRLPTVSLDTVYRTLWLLNDLGLITTLGFPHERHRFDGNTRPHHHFVCTRCGLTGDFYSEELDGLAVAEVVSEFGVADRTQVEVRGLCRSCLEENDRARRKEGEQEVKS